MEKEFETYLGDTICSSGSNKINIENRTNRGIGAVSEIISMLNQVSLGHFHFDIALIFRDSMLISKLVSSSEVWYNVTNHQYSKLEEIDEMYLRKIFDLPKSAPRIGIYAECGKIPVRNIIKTRRILFYWHLLHLEKRELLYKFYLAQKLKPSRNDWILTVFKDMKEIELEMSEEEIINMPRQKFKDVVMSKVKIKVNKQFLKKQGSKTEKLRFNENFTPSTYLFSQKLNVDEIKTLMKLRTRTIDVKQNQSSSFKENMWCRTCFIVTETQQHVYECFEIRKHVGSLDFNACRYEMIFGELDNQVKFAKNYHLMWKARADMIKNGSSPSSSEDPCTVGMQQIV